MILYFMCNGCDTPRRHHHAADTLPCFICTSTEEEPDKAAKQLKCLHPTEEILSDSIADWYPIDYGTFEAEIANIGGGE